MRLVLSLLLVLLVAVAGCKRDAAVKETPAAVPVVTDATADLLFTWIDEKGEFHIETKPGDVPVTARDVVRVRDPAKEQTDHAFVVDLRQAGPEGKYPVREMSRAQFEDLALARRKDGGAVLAERSATPLPKAGEGPPGDPGQRGQVVIYGAEWCGPCHQAAAYFKRKNIPFVEKDIEKDGSAAREMQIKLTKAGRSGGSIPVIDVRGKIVVGFSEAAVESALGTAM